jgi:hypothetical protein
MKRVEQFETRHSITAMLDLGGVTANRQVRGVGQAGLHLGYVAVSNLVQPRQQLLAA